MTTPEQTPVSRRAFSRKFGGFLMASGGALLLGTAVDDTRISTEISRQTEATYPGVPIDRRALHPRSLPRNDGKYHSPEEIEAKTKLFEKLWNERRILGLRRNEADFLGGIIGLSVGLVGAAITFRRRLT